MKMVIALASVVLFNSLGSTVGGREWSDSTGRYQVEADLIGASSGSVRLRRRDGKTVEVRLSRLSRNDRAWVKTELERRASAKPLRSGDLSEDGRAPNRTNGSTEGIAVSLRALRIVSNSPDAKKLYGATQLLGFMVSSDELGADCVLIFAQEPRRPSLHLDDLAVAYRNVADGAARPACTIDPRASVLTQLSRIGRRVTSQQDPHAVERALREWQRVGESPQDVRVFNVGPQTRFASIMVAADYDLKTICNGAARVSGITGLTDLLAQRVEADIAATGTSNAPIGSQNRFWFNPGRVAYRTDGTLFMLSACEITLLTEQEAITNEGRRTSLAQENRLAKQFANQLTKKFPELSRARPVYRELENLYRAVAVMSLVVSEANRLGVGEIVDQALRAVEVAPEPFRKTLPGRVSVKKLQGQIANGTYVVWLPSCGGVSIDIDYQMMKRDAQHPELLTVAAKRIAATRPSPETTSWSFTL